MRYKKNKVHLHKINTDFGKMPVMFNFQKVNRKTVIFYAEREIDGGTESIFYLVRPKDAELLKVNGYAIQSVEVPEGSYPAAFRYSSGTKLEVRHY